MTIKDQLQKRIPKWLAVTFLVFGILFLLGGMTGKIDMLVIGTILTVLAILTLKGNKKLSVDRSRAQPLAPAASTDVSVPQPIQKNKKAWYTKWWGIMLVIFVILPIGLTAFIMAFAIESINETYRQENAPERVAEREKQEAEEQEKRKQEITAKYQNTIDMYAPVYCKNHQDITVNEPDLHEDGWPLANNQLGIDEDDCKILLGLLYYQRVNDPQVVEYIKSISERKVSIGMTKIEVVYAWGSPNDIKRTVSSNGTWEQWVFGNPIYGANYVYFDNNIVTSIQN